MAELNLEAVIKSGVEKALNKPIVDGKSITEWAAIGMKAPRWISVKDRLPEKYEAVIVSVIGHDFEPYVSVAWISADNEWDTDDNLLCRCSWEVTHWMVMPELPPEEVSGE